MTMRRRPGFLFVACLLVLAAFSCSKSGKEAENAPAEKADTDTTVSYLSEEVSFGVFFDQDGTRRTVKLGGGDRQTTAYVIVQFPETMPIAAVEFRLALPQGVTLLQDVGYRERVALLGTIEEGISETFPCAQGPKLVLHTLTLSVAPGLENAEISILPHEKSQFIGVAICDEGRTMIAGTSFKAVINPTD